MVCVAWAFPTPSTSTISPPLRTPRYLPSPTHPPTHPPILYRELCIHIPIHLTRGSSNHPPTHLPKPQTLYNKIKDQLRTEVYDADVEEEFEDSEGNVLNRRTFEDLARQGLL